MCSQSYWLTQIKQETKMKAPLLLVLLLTIVYHAEGNCPDDSNG